MRDLHRESSRKADIMVRKALLDALNRYSDAYRAVHPRTAESDLRLVTAYCSGHSAVHVALDHNCAESTVYRAINRVREFLRLQETDDRWKPLLDHVMEHLPDFGDGDAQSILEMLYEAYCVHNRFDDTATEEGFDELYRLLEDLELCDLDPIIYVVCALCHSHQRTGFSEGIKMGIRLGEELRV